MRYIYNTTGTYSMMRFLKLSANADVPVQHLQCNRHDEFHALTHQQKSCYDVLSRTSNTYYTVDEEVKASVSAVAACLPDRVLHTRRLNCKQFVPAVVAGAAHSQEGAPPKRARQGEPGEAAAAAPSEPTPKELALSQELAEERETSANLAEHLEAVTDERDAMSARMQEMTPCMDMFLKGTEQIRAEREQIRAERDVYKVAAMHLLDNEKSAAGIVMLHGISCEVLAQMRTLLGPGGYVGAQRERLR